MLTILCNIVEHIKRSSQLFFQHDLSMRARAAAVSARAANYSQKEAEFEGHHFMQKYSYLS